MEGNVLFNDTLNTFYFWLHVIGFIVKNHSNNKRENLLLPLHGLLFLISSRGYFIYVQTELTLTSTLFFDSRHDLLVVNVDSKLPSMPDFLEGDLSRGFGLFKVGKYNNQGHPVKSSIVSGESVLIRPIKPFGENNSQSCEFTFLLLRFC